MIENHVIMYLFTTILILSGPVMGMEVGKDAMVLLVLFQVAFFVIHTAGSRVGASSFVISDLRRLTWKSSVAMGLILALALALALPLVRQYASRLYDLSYEAEGTLVRTIKNLSTAPEATVIDGQVSRGNNHQTGTPQIELRTTQMPTETVYMKGFSGGDYVSGDWMPDIDRDIIEQIVQGRRWQQQNRQMFGLFYSMYFMLNGSREGSEAPPPRMMRVRHLNGRYDNLFIAYYSRFTGSFNNSEDDGYGFQYFEQKDMHVDETVLSASTDRSHRELQQVKSIYERAADEVYTRVPREQLPRLTQLVVDNPLENSDEITSFILYTLHSRTSYTLTPGLTPRNEEVVESFLFDRGLGYCVHYAAAATLMYRLYDVPARYASGYLVKPSDFVRQEDGSYLATVTDKAAHAWTELYLENYGWTPVEVTPLSDSTVTTYPGYDEATQQQVNEERGWAQEESDRQESVQESAELPESSEESIAPATVDEPSKQTTRDIPVNTIAIVILLCMLPAFLIYRLRNHANRIDESGVRETFDRYLKLLHRNGYMRGYYGLEENFATQLASELPVVEVIEAIEMLDVVSEAAYGPEKSDLDGTRLVKRIYNRSAHYIFEKLEWHQKLRFQIRNLF